MVMADFHDRERGRNRRKRGFRRVSLNLVLSSTVISVFATVRKHATVSTVSRHFLKPYF